MKEGFSIKPNMKLEADNDNNPKPFVRMSEQERARSQREELAQMIFNNQIAMAQESGVLDELVRHVVYDEDIQELFPNSININGGSAQDVMNFLAELPGEKERYEFKIALMKNLGDIEAIHVHNEEGQARLKI